MKVLLVQSYLGTNQSDGLAYPLGLAYIGAAAEAQGHEVHLVDPNVLPSPMSDLKRIVRSYAPDFVGLSLRNIDSQQRTSLIYYYDNFCETLAAIKEVLPAATPVAVGGAGFSMFAGSIMERHPELDFGLVLEAEESFPELLNNLGDPGLVKGLYHRENEGVVFTGDRSLPDFGNLPYPRRDFLDLNPYRKVPFSMGIQTKRGCALKCLYCNYPFLNGSRFRIRPADDVCDEVEYLAGLGFSNFTFADSMLNVPPRHAEKLLQQLSERGLPIEWGAYMHLRGVDHEFLKLTRKAGCVSILFSPDGISQAAMDALQKDTKEKDLQELVSTLGSHQELATLHVGFSFFINPPGETLSGLLKSLLFYIRVHLLRLKPRAARLRAYAGWIRLEPYTPAYSKALEEGSITPEVDLLPRGKDGLEATFYRHPRLGWMNPLLVGVFKLETWISRLLKQFLHIVRKSTQRR